MSKSSNDTDAYIVKRAQRIAENSLRACETFDGIIAGTHHFVDLWARDSLFATFGSATTTAKRTIETFLQHQKDDGCIPYRIFRRGRIIVSNFRSIQSGGLVPDGGLMTVIASAEYERRSRDTGFMKVHKAQLKKAMGWYEKRFGDNLIREWFQCEWADAVLKVGNTLYTNILYWRALGDIGDRVLQEKIGRKLNEKLWNGTYFSDWFDWGRQDYFAVHPNMLAIIFGLATKKQTESILTVAKKTCWNGWALEENYPRYPWWRIPIGNYLVGMADYHNRGCIWLQPGILYAVALYKHNKIHESRKVLAAIAQKIIEYNGVYEVYEKSGKPVRRIFYRSEGPFAWSAGLFLFACRVVHGSNR